MKICIYLHISMLMYEHILISYILTWRVRGLTKQLFYRSIHTYIYIYIHIFYTL